jgi:EAL domain-containing protein (putative c-di-GMP-specific phosphodiesterase class I)
MSEDSESEYRGMVLSTVFQPIIAVAQSRAAGVEALLRARGPSGVHVAPLDLFAQAERFGEALQLDGMAHEAHLRRFTTTAPGKRWLFLNCRPESLTLDRNGRSPLETAVQAHGYSPSEIVIEVLEQASFTHESVTDAIAAHQQKGFQVAIDDFGIGASNFDRVWGVRPDFVKLDRSLVQRATGSRNDRRVAKMLVSMLHRMGVMVIAEGVETKEEALTVMDADVDFVQGFYFSRPSHSIDIPILNAEAEMVSLWPHLFDLVNQVGAQEQAHVAAVRSMLLSAVRALENGATLKTASKLFFAAPDTLSIFLLDAKGYTVGEAIYKDALPGETLHRVGPIAESNSANWSRRAYFKDALRRPGRPSIHGPHRSMAEGAFVYTTAITLEIDERLHVLCGNFRMDQQELEVAGIRMDAA